MIKAKLFFCSLAFSVSFSPKNRRCTSLHFPEGFGEIAHILEAAAFCDGGHRQVCGGQQLGGALNPVLPQVLDGGGADGSAEAAQAFAFTDGNLPGNVGGAQLVGAVVMDELQHLLDPLCVPLLLGAGLLPVVRCVLVQQQNQLGKIAAHLEFIARLFLKAGLPGGLKLLQKHLLPGDFRLQVQTDQGMIFHQGLDIGLVKHTIQTSTHQPGMEHNAVGTAAGMLPVPAAMENLGIGEETLSGVDNVLFVACSNENAAP